MRKHLKWGLVGLTVLLLLIAGLNLIRSNQEGFDGTRVKNADAYLLDIQRMTGTDLHTLELEAGDDLRVYFETRKGHLHLEIKAPDGTTLYSGNGEQTKEFTVHISQSGVYPILAEARGARGTIHIQAERPSN